MKTILCCLLLSFGTAYGKGPDTTTSSSGIKSNALAVWRASESTISNRLAAAQQLLSAGMNTGAMENLLGKPTQRIRHNPGTNDRIRWRYDYRFPDGIISVQFLQVKDADRFEAEYQSVYIGCEPTIISPPIDKHEN